MAFTYDALGNMLTAARGNATMSLTYDKAGRKLTMDDPDMGDWSYVYNALGGMTSQTDARGCVTNIAYDELNRPTGKTYSNCPATSAVTYTYDVGTNGKGRRTSMGISGADYTSWTYDERGRVIQEAKQITGGGQFVTSFMYNSADLPVTMTYPDGEVLDYDYNNDMRLTSVDGLATYVQSIAYDSAGRMTQMTRGNGILNTTYSYFNWNQQGGRLAQLTTVRPSNQTTLQDFTYSYDSVGNILTITDSLSGPQTQNFAYDALDRLISADAAGGTNGLYSENYSYNGTTGNLASKAGVNYTYSTTHKHAVASLSNGNSYSYDSNGNMTTRNVDGQTYNLAYDAENRLVSVTGAATANYVYDGDGKQIKSAVNGVTTYYVGNHYEVKSSLVTKYYFAGSTRVAVRKDGTLSYLLGDHLGSSSVTTNASGAKTASLMYKAWGETRHSTGTMPTDFRYTGQREESAIGLHYYGARWYDSSLSRFIQADTILPKSQGTQAWDRYAYVNNRPVNFSDPTGHCWGEAAGIRGFLGYGTMCANVEQAWSIATNSKASNSQRFVASAYIGVVVGAHVQLAVGVAILACVGAKICSAGEVSKEPSQLRRGNDYHYNYGPDQLQEMYPDTEFEFKGRGEAGPDVEVVGGKHPSEYPDSTWDPANDYGDFKTNKPWSEYKFESEIDSGKLPENTQPLPYDPEEFELSPTHEFGPF